MSRNALAPARSDSNTYSSRSKVVSTSTRGAPLAGADLPGRLDPVEVRHADVHQDDVRAELGRLTTASLPSSASPTTSMSGSPFEDHPESGANEALVVREEDADHRGLAEREARPQRVAALGTAPDASSPP